MRSVVYAAQFRRVTVSDRVDVQSEDGLESGKDIADQKVPVAVENRNVPLMHNDSQSMHYVDTEEQRDRIKAFSHKGFRVFGEHAHTPSHNTFKCFRCARFRQEEELGDEQVLSGSIVAESVLHRSEQLLERIMFLIFRGSVRHDYRAFQLDGQNRVPVAQGKDRRPILQGRLVEQAPLRRVVNAHQIVFVRNVVELKFHESSVVGFEIRVIDLADGVHVLLSDFLGDFPFMGRQELEEQLVFQHCILWQLEVCVGFPKRENFLQKPISDLGDCAHLELKYSPKLVHRIKQRILLI